MTLAFSRKIPKSHVQVWTEEWRASHGPGGPRGRGRWGFEIRTTLNHTEDEQFWPEGYLLYSEAKALAIAFAASRGSYSIGVLP